MPSFIEKKPKKIPSKSKPPKKQEVKKIKSDTPTLHTFKTIEPIDLPSQGKAYPENTTIRYSTFTLGEVKQLSESDYDEKSYIPKLLEHVHITGMEPEQLTLSDFMYLSMLIKISSCGTEKTKVTTVCNSCEKDSTFDFSLEDLELLDLPPKLESLPLTYKNQKLGLEFELGPMTVGDYYYLLDKNKAQDPIAFLTMFIKSMDFKEGYDFFSKLGIEHVIKFRNVIDKYLTHGVKDLQPICRNVVKTEVVDDKDQNILCNSKMTVSLQGGDTEFSPFLEESFDMDEDGISFS